MRGALLSTHAASLPRKEHALRELLHIRENLRLPSEIFRDAFVLDELQSFGFLLPLKKRNALPLAAQKTLQASYHRGALEAVATWLGWRRTRSYAAREAAFFDASIEERDRRLEEFGADISKEWNSLVQMSVPRYQIFDDKLRRGRAHADQVLVLLAADLHRTRTGKWPADLDELVAAGLLPAAPIDGRTGRLVAFLVDDEHLRLPRDPQNIAKTDEEPRTESVLTISPDR